MLPLPRIRTIVIGLLIVIVPIGILVLFGTIRNAQLSAQATQRDSAYVLAWLERREAIVEALKRFEEDNGKLPENKAEFIAFDADNQSLLDELPHQAQDIAIWFELLDHDERLLIAPEPGYITFERQGILERSVRVQRYARSDPWGIFNDLSKDSYSDHEYQHALSLREE